MSSLLSLATMADICWTVSFNTSGEETANKVGIISMKGSGLGIDGRKVKRISRGKGLYGTPVWSPRGDLIAFTKIFKGKFYIGVMRTDGSGERLLTENFYQEAPSWSPNGRVLVFYRETKSGPQGKGFSAKLWSIDITGYNERKIKTETDASDPSWSSLLSK